MSERDSSGLRLIFSIFLGLMLTAFVGVGINTFHPSPAATLDERTRPLIRDRNAYDATHPEAQRTPAERATLQEKRERVDAVIDASRAATRAWYIQTSVILIICATLLMGLSMWRADAWPVVGNGLLLGGVFTMIYGVGMNIAATESLTRFFVLVGAVAVTIAMGWWRFVRGRPVVGADVAHRGGTPGAVAGQGSPTGDLTALVARIDMLERRLSAMAEALR